MVQTDVGNFAQRKRDDMVWKNKKSILYSILELALIPAGNSAADIFKNVKEVAQRAEKLGYTRFWLAEHHNSVAIASSATSVLIGDVAGVTKTIRVGSGGIMLPNHSPLIIAEQFATLALLYPNRIDLGLGRAPGTDQLTATAIRPDRMRSVLNFPEEIMQIQQYLSMSNRGSKVRVPFGEGVNLPMYILGSSTDSAYLAAEMGLPYAFASHFSTTHLSEALSIYRKQFKPSTHLKQPYTIAGVNIIVSESNEDAERELTSLIRMFYGVLTGVPDFIQAPVPMSPEIKEVWKHPQVQQMLKYTFYGDHQTVKTKAIEFLAQTQADELMIVSNQYSHKGRVRSFESFAAIMKEINEFGLT